MKQIIIKSIVGLICLGIMWSAFVFADKSNWPTGAYSFMFYIMLPSLSLMIISTPIIVYLREHKKVKR